MLCFPACSPIHYTHICWHKRPFRLWSELTVLILTKCQTKGQRSALMWHQKVPAFCIITQSRRRDDEQIWWDDEILILIYGTHLETEQLNKVFWSEEHRFRIRISSLQQQWSWPQKTALGQWSRGDKVVTGMDGWKLLWRGAAVRKKVVDLIYPLIHKFSKTMMWLHVSTST